MAEKHLRNNSREVKDDADKEIFQAVIEGNVRDVYSVLKEKSDRISQKAKNSVLILACRGRHKQSAKLLLYSGACFEFQDHSGNTALMVSAENGLVDFVELLIMMGADVNAVNANGDTALILSINEGLSVEMLNVLIEAKADVDKENNKGVKAITRAIQILDLDAVFVLLRNGATYDCGLKMLAADMGLDSVINHLISHENYRNIRDVWGGLQMAAKCLDMPSMKQFLSCKLNSSNSDSMIDAIEIFIESLPHIIDNSHIKMIKVMLRRASLCISERRLQLLILFAIEKNGNLRLIEILLKDILSQHGLENIRWICRNPLNVSVQCGRCYLIPLFLDNGFEVESPVTSSYDTKFVPSVVHYNNWGIYDPKFVGPSLNVSSNSLMMEAIYYEQLGCLKFLLNKYPLDLTTDLLMEAVDKGNEEMVETLIRYGANPNGELERFYFQPTVLATAVGKNIPGIVRILLENGVDVNYKIRQNGATCLKWAITQSSSISMVSQLLDAGADINTQDNDKQTPLFYAVSSDNAEVVELLIRKGADLNVRDKFGKTALLYSVLESGVNVTNMLLTAGAEVDVKDDEGRTALLLATEIAENDRVETLISNHASLNIQNNKGLTALMVASKGGGYYAEEITSALVNAGAAVNAVNQVDGVTTALSGVLQKMNIYFRQTDVKVMTILLKSGASPSAAPSCAFAVHGAILFGSLHLVQLLIENGFGPLEIAGDTLSQIIIENKTMGDILHSLSPLVLALLKGKARIARYLSELSFFTERDAWLPSAEKSAIRHYLVRRKFTNCLQIWDDLHSQPWSLFRLSFVRVSTAIGGGAIRRELIDQTPLPPILKRKLNFQGLEATSTYTQSEDDQTEQKPESQFHVHDDSLEFQTLMYNELRFYETMYNDYPYVYDSDNFANSWAFNRDSDDYSSD